MKSNNAQRYMFVAAAMSAGMLLLPGCDEQKHDEPKVRSYIDAIVEPQPAAKEETSAFANNLRNQNESGVDGRVISDRESCMLNTWHFKGAPGGTAEARTDPSYWFKTPTRSADIGDNVFKRRQDEAWRGFGASLAKFKYTPSSSNGYPLFKQIQAISRLRKGAKIAGSENNVLCIVSALEDSDLFDPEKPTPDWNNNKPPLAGSDLPDLNGMEVFVRQLAPQSRKPAKLAAFWNGLFKASGATIRDPASMTSQGDLALPRVPEDRVTAILVDRTDPVSAADLDPVCSMLATSVKPQERLFIYSLEPGAGRSYVSPKTDIVREASDSDAEFLQTIKTELQPAVTPTPSTLQSPIIECLLAIANGAEFSTKTAKKRLPDYPERIHRRLLLVSDLQQNSKDTGLLIANGRGWWEEEHCWDIFSKGGYWKQNKPALEQAEIHVFSLRRDADVNTLKKLHEFWNQLLNDTLNDPKTMIEWHDQPTALTTTGKDAKAVKQ